MPSFPLPSTADVRAASKLRPENFNPLFSSEQFDVAISALIVEAGAFVEGQILKVAGASGFPLSEEGLLAIWPAIDAPAEITRQNALATSATKYEALSRLFEEAGQLSDQFDEESDRYAARSERDLAQLIGAISEVARQQSSETTTVRVPPSRSVRISPVW